MSEQTASGWVDLVPPWVATTTRSTDGLLPLDDEDDAGWVKGLPPLDIEIVAKYRELRWRIIDALTAEIGDEATAERLADVVLSAL